MQSIDVKYNPHGSGFRHGAGPIRAKKMAIVEDVPQVAEAYALTLRLYGHEVALSLRSGEECMKAALIGKLADVDCVLLDYNMAGMDGLRVGKVLKELKPTIRVIIASANDEIEEISRSEGFDCLKKPFSTSQLIDSVA